VTEVIVEGDIDAPLQDVWAVVSDFGGFLRALGMQTVTDGRGVGMTRSTSVGDETIVERLESVDDASRTTSYAIISGDVPFSCFVGEIALSPVGLGEEREQTHLLWTATFTPNADTEELTAALCRNSFAASIQALQSHLTRK
jgi:hypothetical protein